MADQAGQQEIRIKGGPQSGSQRSRPTTQAVHIKRGIPAPAHRDGRNNAWLRGRDFSLTGHTTAQPSMLLAALGPRLNQFRRQARQYQVALPQTHFSTRNYGSNIQHHTVRL